MISRLRGVRGIWLIATSIVLLSLGAFFYARKKLSGAKGCPWFFEKGPDPGGISSNDYVEFERTECFGSCPAYVVRVQANGMVSWHGKNFVAVEGDQTARVNPSEAKALIESSLKRGIWSLCSSYEQPITDLPTWITTLHVGKLEKRVQNYAQSAPAWLDDFDRNVDALADTHRWRHGDPRVEELDGRHIVQDADDPKPGVTALMRAAGRGDLAAVMDLLGQGADPNAQDSSGWSALIYALPDGRKEVLEALIKAGADPHVRSATGQTSLMAAVVSGWKGREETVSLLASQSDINAQDQDGKTALMLAVRPGFGRVKLLERLFELGANRELRDVHGRTARDLVLQQPVDDSSDHAQVLQLLQASLNPK
ncbi:MAG TPA: ankyrin repeat domain-containing protein [Bryobacteraceae bacterium]|jgi:hypothetical protein